MLLNNLKTVFFMKDLFSYIDEGVKLKIIKYNKKIQGALDINLINYKMFSWRYIKFESNGYGKEYSVDNNQLVFEGEYKNGRRNGKGKEYEKNGEIIYEGEYLNGKRNGKGKENGRFAFEGEFLRGKKWNGKGYEEGELIYELKNGKGFVKEYNDYDGNVFEGEYENGLRNGKGTESNEYGIFFDGEYLNGRKWNGKIIDIQGNVACELKNGKGVYKSYDGDNILKNEGKYENGVLKGKLTIYEDDGTIALEGEILDFKRHGRVKEYYNGKIISDCEYLYDHKFKGKEYVNGILEYEGEYLIDKKWNGIGYDEKGNKLYELKNGCGKVKIYSLNILIFEGEYLNGNKNGKCKEYNDSGDLIFEGEYLNGIKNGKGKKYKFQELVFEGEYLNGKRWNGIKKKYDFSEKIISEYEYLNGKKKLKA